MRERKRVLAWDDPTIGAAAMPGMSGFQYLHSMMGKKLPPPPMGELLNMTLVDAAPGAATVTCYPDEFHYNPIGSVHGGRVCTLLDSALGCAVQTTLPKGLKYTSIEIKVNYLRSVRADSDPLTCVGVVSKPGNRVAFADGTVTDARGKLVATATGSSLLVFTTD